MRKSLFFGFVSALLLGGATIAHAQIGSGWTAFSPSSVIQVEVHDVGSSYPGTTTSIKTGGVVYTNSGGIETYQLVNTQSNRVERRYNDDYTSGKRQFQADIKIYSPTNNESIHQVFNGKDGGPWLIVREMNSNNGSIRMGGGTSSGTLASNLYGTWFRLNSLNVISGNTKIYVNGSQKWSSNHPSGGFYTKYGCYGTLGASSAKIQFKNVKMFK